MRLKPRRFVVWMSEARAASVGAVFVRRATSPGRADRTGRALVVQEQPVDAGRVALHGDLAQPGVALDAVPGLEPHAQRVEKRARWRPERRPAEVQDNRLAPRSGRPGRDRAPVQGGDVHTRAWRCTRRGHAHGQRPGVHVGRHRGICNVSGGHHHDPDGLPDTGDRGVPDAFGSSTCLPRGWGPRSVGSHTPTSRSCSPRARRSAVMWNIETMVPAAMHADGAAVHADFRFPVHRAEMQQQALTRREARGREGAVIPRTLRVGNRLPDAAQAATLWERNQMRPTKAAGGAGVAAGNRKIPRAVQVGPAAAHCWRDAGARAARDPTPRRRPTAGPPAERPRPAVRPRRRTSAGQTVASTAIRSTTTQFRHCKRSRCTAHSRRP